jgi:ZIP family zinc transporter
MGSAVLWGAVAASSLVVGALVGLVQPWPDRLVGLVLAFGAGALISAVSFDLWEEGSKVGDPGYVGLGLAVGAATYFAADRRLSRQRGGGRALALGAFLDGIPEQAVLGIGLARGRA